MSMQALAGFASWAGVLSDTIASVSMSPIAMVRDLDVSVVLEADGFAEVGALSHAAAEPRGVCFWVVRGHCDIAKFCTTSIVIKNKLPARVA